MNITKLKKRLDRELKDARANAKDQNKDTGDTWWHGRADAVQDAVYWVAELETETTAEEGMPSRQFVLFLQLLGTAVLAHLGLAWFCGAAVCYMICSRINDVTTIGGGDSK